MLSVIKRSILAMARSAGYEIVRKDALPTAPAAAPMIAPLAPTRPISPIFESEIDIGEFDAAMAEYERKFVPQRATDPGNQWIVDALTTEGFCMVPDFFPPEEIKAMHDEGVGFAVACANGTLVSDVRQQRYLEDGVFRLHKVESLAPTTAPFYSDARIADVAQAYLAGHARRMEKYLDYKFEPRPDGNIFQHFDNCYRMLKVYLYLVDLEEENAPTNFWRRSQQRRPWRRLPDYVKYIDHAYGQFGFVPGPIFDELGKGENADIERVVCAGKAGTALFFDSSGLHAASIPRSSYRLALVDNWMTFDGGWVHPWHRKHSPPEGYI
jgi:hypothetical protein